jgi:LysM repeat protein
VPDPAIERFPHSSAGLRVHTVRRGETMRVIARRYDTTPERLMRINGLRKPVIFPGQTLLLTASTSRSSRATKARAAEIRAENAAHERSKARSTSESGAAKHSGAGSKAGARTKSKSAKKTTHRAN